jgi:hypothetical protein
MTNLKVLTAVALLSAAVSPVWAQAAIQEPGAFAFYHPSADVLNPGVPQGSYAYGSAYAAVGGARVSSCEQHRRAYDPVSGTVRGGRHSCD